MVFVWLIQFFCVILHANCITAAILVRCFWISGAKVLQICYIRKYFGTKMLFSQNMLCFYVTFTLFCTKNLKNRNILILLLMETDVKQRIKDFLKSKNVTLNSIAGGDSALKMTLSRQINGSTAISQITISLLLDRFPDLSAEWLLRGNGDMLTTGHVAIENIAPVYQNNGNGGNNVTQNMANAEIADKLLSRLETSQSQLTESLSQNKQLISIISKLTDK